MNIVKKQEKFKEIIILKTNYANCILFNGVNFVLFFTLIVFRSTKFWMYNSNIFLSITEHFGTYSYHLM